MHGNFGRLVIMAVCLAAYGFFGWHLTKGPRSLAYQQSVRQELAAARARLDAVVARRERQEAIVARLRADSLDPDMLDEQARRLLGFARPGEIVILSDRR
ncbi:MAG TPA: septum formation initiator family protein [Thermopetrobacter sp.]|nr:septum formation initiator family protein [Thermopetrobacter sp.]